MSALSPRRLLLSALLLWMGLAILATVAPLADWLVLPPRFAPPPGAPGQVRRVLPWEWGQLEVWERKGPLVVAGKSPALRVLCFCGQGDRAQQKRWDVMDLVDDVPVSFSTVNYPGYGGTTGPSRMSRMGSCALAAFDAVRAGDAKCPVVVSGYSLGAVSALYVAARRPVAGVVIINPPSLREMFLRQGWWNLWALAFPAAAAVPEELDTVGNAAAARGPGVILTSTADEVVPYALQQRAADAYGGRKRVLVTSQRHDLALDEPLKREIRWRLKWLLQLPGSENSRSWLGTCTSTGATHVTSPAGGHGWPPLRPGAIPRGAERTGRAVSGGERRPLARGRGILPARPGRAHLEVGTFSPSFTWPRHSSGWPECQPARPCCAAARPIALPCDMTLQQESAGRVNSEWAVDINKTAPLCSSSFTVNHPPDS